MCSRPHVMRSFRIWRILQKERKQITTGSLPEILACAEYFYSTYEGKRDMISELNPYGLRNDNLRSVCRIHRRGVACGCAAWHYPLISCKEHCTLCTDRRHVNQISSRAIVPGSFAWNCLENIEEKLAVISAFWVERTDLCSDRRSAYRQDRSGMRKNHELLLVCSSSI